jgi:molecular chaperone GrpE
MVREEMLKILEQLGVRRIDPEPGDRFDPHIHEAMMRQQAEGVEPNHVAQAFAPGYVYKHRTLRPAKVAVVPEPEQGDEGESEQSGEGEG